MFYFVNHSYKKSNKSKKVTLLIFISQLFTGIVIDWMISNSFPLNKVIGGLFVVLGLGYNLYIDYLDSKKI